MATFFISIFIVFILFIIILHPEVQPPQKVLAENISNLIKQNVFNYTYEKIYYDKKFENLYIESFIDYININIKIYYQNQLIASWKVCKFANCIEDFWYNKDIFTFIALKPLLDNLEGD